VREKPRKQNIPRRAVGVFGRNKKKKRAVSPNKDEADFIAQKRGGAPNIGGSKDRPNHRENVKGAVFPG